MSAPPPKALDEGLASCHACGKVSSLAHSRCPRCGARLHARKPASIQRTLAFLIAAGCFYVPANLLPIMTLSEWGQVTESNIVRGIILFWDMEAYLIAVVIFVASLVIPLVKIVALSWLCAAATGRLNPSAQVLGRVYWLTELMGRWSMIDIFVVAIMVALVQFGTAMTVWPKPGALAFAAVVILTMFAAMSFDPRLLWDRLDLEQRMGTVPPTPHDE